MPNEQVIQAKNYFWIILDVLLGAMFLCLIFFGIPAMKRYGDSIVSPRTMSVSAEGKTTVVPDLATASFSVVSRGLDPKEVAAKNNEKITQVIDFVKSQGTDAKDIKTAGYNLSPDYRYDPDTGKSSITGYTLTQTVAVKMRDFEKIGGIIAGVTDLGVNQIGGINFSVEDPEKYLELARTDAFSRAEARAKAMADASGVSLGRVLNVQESQGGAPVPLYAAGFGAAKDMAAASVPAPSIEPGSQDVTLNVSLTYELK